MMMEQPTGNTYAAPKIASKSPRTCATPSMAGVPLAGSRAQEELLDGLEMPAVGEEQDHVIVLLHDSVVVSHDDLLAAHDRADERAFGEVDLLDRAADDPGGALVAMHHGLQCFRRTPAQ